MPASYVRVCPRPLEEWCEPGVWNLQAEPRSVAWHKPSIFGERLTRQGPPFFQRDARWRPDEALGPRNGRHSITKVLPECGVAPAVQHHAEAPCVGGNGDVAAGRQAT